MNVKWGLVTVASLAAGAFLNGFGQEKPAPPAPRIAVVELRFCFDRNRVEWVKEIDQELQKLADGLTQRMKDADPKEKERLRNEYLSFYERKKLEIYVEVSRIVEALGREKHYSLVLKADPVPSAEGSSISISNQIGDRGLLFHEGTDDLTEAVIGRLNELHAERKKKAPEKKDKDF